MGGGWEGGDPTHLRQDLVNVAACRVGVGLGVEVGGGGGSMPSGSPRFKAIAWHG